MFKHNHIHKLTNMFVMGLAMIGLVGLITPAVPVHARSTCYGRTVTLYAQPGQNTISPGNQVILGTAGDDNIYASAGDVVCGRDGNDTIAGAEGNEFGGVTILGGPGNDTIWGSDHGGDLIFGGQGNDVIVGGRKLAPLPQGKQLLRTIIYGDDGNDRMYANRFGLTYMNGGNGGNTCYQDSVYSSSNTTLNCFIIQW